MLHWIFKLYFLCSHDHNHARRIMARLIPNKSAVSVLEGNSVEIPRTAEVVLCSPSAAAVYTLPKLSLEPDVGSYIQGQMLQIRNRTAYTITLTAADGDTVGGNASLEIGAQGYVILVYAGDSDWLIVASLTSAADPEPSPETLAARAAAKVAPMTTGNTATGNTATGNTAATAAAALGNRATTPLPQLKTTTPKRR